MKHHLLPVSPKTMHWGYFSKKVAPSLTLKSGDRATIETLTHHANDDYERMIADDLGAEAVFHWTREQKTMARRGSGPTEGPFIRGAGEGVGVHLLTGPVAVENAEPGDILEVRILDIRPRPACKACYAGKCFGSNAAANWGFHYHDLIEEPKPREVVTIFELDTSGEPFAKAVYNYVWTPQTDPDGIVHATIDYPGVRVDHATIRKRDNILTGVKVPARLHFGTMGLAPSEQDFVSSIPPNYTGGNIDDWRIGKGARFPARSFRSATPMPPRATANSAAPRSRPRSPATSNSSCARRTIWPAPRWRVFRIPCWRMSRPGRSTVLPTRIIWRSLARSPKPRSPTIRAWTGRCATRSANCGAS
jgi:acetamidase/formamidase